jgi:23S rRNA (cytidine1920-2'-O)/16S rRNA (cytidine1409-2'-O)-methyltransferase
VVRRRLDVELVRRGLADSRERARADIEAGRVTVAGAPAAKPSRQVAPDEAVEVHGLPPRFVGRGGHKLAAALERFGIDVAGRSALDAGSSTGGFTDCLLQAGAERVVAVDVGRAQLHERLRADPRVSVLEGTDVRAVERSSLPTRPDIVVADLSFISLRLVLGHLALLVAESGDLVVLVKPQFEAGRREADRGRGVIRDPDTWRRVLTEVSEAASHAGLGIIAAMASPIRGAQGNVEFLLHLAPGVDRSRPEAVAELLGAALDEGREVLP